VVAQPASSSVGPEQVLGEVLDEAVVGVVAFVGVVVELDELELLELLDPLELLEPLLA
jgi:hypothetical protein